MHKTRLDSVARTNVDPNKLPQLDKASEKFVEETRDLILKKTMAKNELDVEAQQQRKETEMEQNQINQQIAEIKLTTDGKITCLFNPQDPIFSL